MLPIFGTPALHGARGLGRDKVAIAITSDLEAVGNEPRDGLGYLVCGFVWSRRREHEIWITRAAATAVLYLPFS